MFSALPTSPLADHSAFSMRSAGTESPRISRTPTMPTRTSDLRAVGMHSVLCVLATGPERAVDVEGALEGAVVVRGRRQPRPRHVTTYT
eukprot:2901077-Prymnesium_polylepis.1